VPLSSSSGLPLFRSAVHMSLPSVFSLCREFMRLTLFFHHPEVPSFVSNPFPPTLPAPFLCKFLLSGVPAQLPSSIKQSLGHGQLGTSSLSRPFFLSVAYALPSFS